MLIADRNGFATRRRWKNPYVTDGLVAWVDAIENAGRGIHDASETGYWTNLVTNQKFKFTSNSSGPDNSYYVEVSPNSLTVANKCIAIPLQSLFNAFTLEWVGDERPIDGNYGYSVLCSHGGNVSGNIIGFTSLYYNWTGTNAQIFLGEQVGVSWSSRIVAHVVSYADGIIRTYSRDRELLATKETAIAPVQSPTLCLPVKDNSWSNVIQTVHAIRLYNRALTADEISANYAIDKARFNLP